MKDIFVFLANGFEDIEALATVDILRRAGLPVSTVSINADRHVTSAHDITVLADMVFDEARLDGAAMLILPGGMPGAEHLKNHRLLGEALKAHNERGALIGAICAAPMVLGHLGLLQGRQATCYPGFESHLAGAHYTADLVTEDGNIITGRGPGAAFAFAYHIAARFVGADVVEQLKAGMIYQP